MLIQVHGVEKPFLNAQIAIELGNQITPNLDHRYISWQDLIPLYDENHHLTRTTTQVKCYKLKNYKTVTRDGRIQEGLTAVLNWASKNSSFRSKTLSFSFKTASLLLVADSVHNTKHPLLIIISPNECCCTRQMTSLPKPCTTSILNVQKAHHGKTFVPP